MDYLDTIKSMKEQFVTYALAKLAKEKGFDEECLFCFVEEPEPLEDEDDNNYFDGYGWNNFQFTTEGMCQNFDDCGKWKKNSEFNNSICSPSYSQLFDWFDNKFDIDICIQKRSGLYWIEISNKGKFVTPLGLNCPTKIEAMKKGVEEAFKLLK